jgi:hypothetical protein
MGRFLGASRWRNSGLTRRSTRTSRMRGFARAAGRRLAYFVRPRSNLCRRRSPQWKSLPLERTAIDSTYCCRSVPRTRVRTSRMNGRAQFRLSRYIRGFAIKPAATPCKRFALRCDSHLRYLHGSRPRVANFFAPTAPIFQLMPIFPFLAPGPNPAVNADAPPAALRARRGSPVTLIR